MSWINLLLISLSLYYAMGEGQPILMDKVHQLQYLLEDIVNLVGNHSSKQDCQDSATQYYRNCVDVKNAGLTMSGEYTLAAYVHKNRPVFVKVYCDMDTDGGGWLVFQRRRDGSVNFYRNWNDYAQGFGSVSGEFWLGNIYLHFITSQSPQELRIDMRDGKNTMKFASYSNFILGPAASKFPLIVSGYRGTAGDSFGVQSGYKFTTRDRDNDNWSSNCAQKFKGGWWYHKCHSSNLNGLYLNGSHTSYADGIDWYTWHGFHYSLPFTEMKIRPFTPTSA